MLPAHLHIEVARLCCVQKRVGHRFYVSDAMQELDEAKENNLIFMNEIDWIQVLIT
jgi:hypothetical protein